MILLLLGVMKFCGFADDALVSNGKEHGEYPAISAGQLMVRSVHQQRFFLFLERPSLPLQRQDMSNLLECRTVTLR